MRFASVHSGVPEYAARELQTLCCSMCVVCLPREVGVERVLGCSSFGLYVCLFNIHQHSQDNKKRVNIFYSVNIFFFYSVKDFGAGGVRGGSITYHSPEKVPEAIREAGG